MRKTLFPIITLTLVILTLTSQSVYSQIGFGASYENRSEEPTNGFGLHVQLSLLNLPVLSLSARAHYSYYSEENRVSRQGINYSEDRSQNEIGGTVIASAGLGLISPYVGVGIGWQNFSVQSRILSSIDADVPDGFEEADEDAAKYFGVIGVAVTPVPLLRPFIEYRYAGISKDDFGPSSYGTWVFGVQIRL